MKLRNKNTGEIGEIRYENHELYIDTDEGFTYWLRTIAKLNEEWEDYEPKEPLIKDEKVRKAVKAWAEANDFGRVFYEYDFSNDVARFIVCEAVMVIEADELLEEYRWYTIAELCGEDGE